MAKNVKRNINNKLQNQIKYSNSKAKTDNVVEISLSIQR